MLIDEDSGAHQIAWTALGDADRAVADMRSLLNFQLENGRIPEIINWCKKRAWYDPFMEFVGMYSTTEYVDLTQIPVLPYSLRAIYNATGDDVILKEFVPKLVKFFNWWKKNRDLDGTGVVTILHPWESGIDLSPCYDSALGIPLADRARPSWSNSYAQLIKLGFSYRWRYRWNQEKILSRRTAARGPINWFKVQDIAVNCVYASGWGVLGDLASKYDLAIATECYANQKHSEAGILKTLYSESAGRFVTGYKDGNNVQSFYGVKTVQTLFPLLLNSISSEQVSGIVAKLTDENEFWTAYPVPSVSKAEPEYNPVMDTKLLWRGPTWGFTNWFIMEGLQKHGQNVVLGEMMERWISMVKKGGIYEMYNPETGVGYGPEGLGMSTLIVDWMQRLSCI